MALTVANECKKAALDGITALFNGGNFVLQATGPTTLASLTLNATAFGAATTASPSVAASNSITADTTVTAGTITLFRLETSGGSVRINGTVGTSGADINVSDNVIPPGATQVSSSGINLTLQLT